MAVRPKPGAWFATPGFLFTTAKRKRSISGTGKPTAQSDAWEQMDEITAEMKRVADTGPDLSFFDFIQGTPHSGSVKDLGHVLCGRIQRGA